MAWSTPTSRAAGYVIPADEWNKNTVDNPEALRAGGIAIASQAANDVLYAASDTQLARLGAGTAGQVLTTQGVGSAPIWSDPSEGLRQSFQGLTLRTHPDADLAATRVMLTHADEIVLSDGTRVADWDNLVANIGASGAGGLDTGSPANSAWYSIHAIRKSSDGTKNLLLHRAQSYDLDQSFGTDNTNDNVRVGASDRVKLAQGFQVSVAGPLVFIDLHINKTNTPTGNLWATIESDSGGNPSGTALATSDKFDVSMLPTTKGYIRFVFRVPASLAVSTQYHIVLQGDWAMNGTNVVSWRGASAGGYANGSAKKFDGTNWASAAPGDFNFRVYVTQNDTALTMPTDYDQHALVGWVYRDSGGNFVGFGQNDRTVRRVQATAATGFTSLVAVLTDVSAIVPPVPVVLSHWTIVSNGVGNALYAYPGFNNQVNNAGLFYTESLVANRTQGFGADLLCEFQHVYFLVTGGSNGWGIAGFRW